MVLILSPTRPTCPNLSSYQAAEAEALDILRGAQVERSALLRVNKTEPAVGSPANRTVEVDEIGSETQLSETTSNV